MINTKEYGQFLQDERERQGLSFERVSKETRISIKILQGLESMEKNLFPSEVYQVGMLKSYAKYLKIDQDVILQMLKKNEIQEKPVEFDLISIQEKKNKKRIRVLLGAIGGIVAVFILYISFQYLYTFISSSNQEKIARKNNNSSLTIIDGFYESNIMQNERIRIISNDIEGIFEIISINPPKITLNNQEYAIKINQPLSLDLDNDNIAEYTLFMRSVNISRKQLLLRFDPSVEQVDFLKSADLQESAFFLERKTLKEIEVSTANTQTPYQVKMIFSQDSYYKVLSAKKKVIAEGLIKKGGRKNISGILEPIEVQVSNASFVNITINAIPMNIEKTGLPYVFYLGWKHKNNKFILSYAISP